jgi:hypothetical protein
MEIHTRIESTATTADHHVECGTEHERAHLRFTSTTADGGRGVHDALNCMLFEMEDAAEASLRDAWESTDDAHFWTPDEDSLRDVAVYLAERADRLDVGVAVWTLRTVNGDSD